jgi:hypothetical protein
MDGPEDVIKLPECLLGLVLPGVRGQLTHHGRLRHILLCKGCQDTLDVRPFLDDQRIEGLARRLDQAMGIVVWMVESDEAGHPLVQVAVTRRELVAEDEQKEEIHLIGAVVVQGAYKLECFFTLLSSPK